MFARDRSTHDVNGFPKVETKIDKVDLQRGSEDVLLQTVIQASILQFSISKPGSGALNSTASIQNQKSCNNSFTREN
jgi:hypothetical protein